MEARTALAVNDPFTTRADEPSSPESRMYLVEIFLPLQDNEGHVFRSSLFSGVRRELVDRFGGITAFTREPAEGLWDAPDGDKCHDAIIIYEVMVQKLDRPWWESYKADLENRFEQEELVIRVSTIDVI